MIAKMDIDVGDQDCRESSAGWLGPFRREQYSIAAAESNGDASGAAGLESAAGT
jgi:hypothetical protein